MFMAQTTPTEVHQSLLINILLNSIVKVKCSHQYVTLKLKKTNLQSVIVSFTYPQITIFDVDISSMVNKVPDYISITIGSCTV